MACDDRGQDGNGDRDPPTQPHRRGSPRGARTLTLRSIRLPHNGGSPGRANRAPHRTHASVRPTAAARHAARHGKEPTLRPTILLSGLMAALASPFAPAFAKKSGGVLKMSHRDNPPSASILEGATNS